jgi:hypothetical protein
VVHVMARFGLELIERLRRSSFAREGPSTSLCSKEWPAMAGCAFGVAGSRNRGTAARLGRGEGEWILVSVRTDGRLESGGK